MEIISWSAIEAECGDYRDGFVKTFKKYEGMETDEFDGYGRTVVVTAASFARHAGIAERTFQRWVEKDAGVASISDDRSNEDRARRALRSLPAAEKSRLVAEIMDEHPEIAEIARGSGPWVDPDERTRPTLADHKAAEAHARQRTSPIYRGMAQTGLELAVEAFREVVDAVREAVANDAVVPSVMEELDAIHDEYVLARQEADFKLGAV